MAFDSLTYRKVLGQFATGVTLITTRGEDGPWAMTANSFTSISLNPPIVMVAVTQGLTTNLAIRNTRAFAVNILRADQMHLAKRFSSRVRPQDQFDDVALSAAVTGAPVIESCLAWVDCRLVDMTEQGDHTVFFGGVEDLSLGRPSEPLLYYNSAYARIDPVPVARPEKPGASMGRLIFFEWEQGDY